MQSEIYIYNQLFNMKNTNTQLMLKLDTLLFIGVFCVNDTKACKGEEAMCLAFHLCVLSVLR